MKKTKILLMMTLIIALILCPFSGAGMVVKAADEGVPDVKMEFINVCPKDGKADATLIQANKELVLVDCGATNEKTYKELKKRIKVRYLDAVGQEALGKNEKIKIKAIIITHNHIDHMGALSKMLKDADFKIEQVCYSAVKETKKYKGSRLESIDKAVKKKGLKVKKMKSLPKSSKCKEDDLKPYIIRLGGTDVKVYRTINKADYINITDNDAKKETLVANNRSMIVRVVTNNAYVDKVNANSENTKITTKSGMNALLLGDICINGLVAAKNVYGSKIFSLQKEYKICKFGHHGDRPSSCWHKTVKMSELKKRNKSLKDSKLSFWKKSSSTKETYVDSEIRFYNEYIGASYYVFDTTNGAIQKESKSCVAAYNKFIGGSLKTSSNEKSTCVKLGNLFHMYPSMELKRASISTGESTDCVKLKKK